MSLFNILLLVSFIVIVVGFNLYDLKLYRDRRKAEKEKKQRDEKRAAELKNIYKQYCEDLLTGLNDIKSLKERDEITLRRLANMASDHQHPELMLIFMSMVLMHAMSASFEELYSNLNSRGL